jgi:hypothetical protein
VTQQRAYDHHLDEARTALNSAEEAIARIRARLGAAETARTGSDDRRSMHGANNSARGVPSEPGHRHRVGAIAAELAALDDAALERLRAEAASALTHYVTAAVEYNSSLTRLREDLRDFGALDVVDLDVLSQDGRSGISVYGVTRLRVRPWQDVSEMAWTALRAHAPVPHMSLDAPQDPEFAPLSPTRPHAPVSAGEPGEWRWARQHAASDTFVPPPAPVSERIVDDAANAGGTGGVAPGRAAEPAVRDLVLLMSQQIQEIVQLRKQLNDQAAIVAQVASYVEYLSLLYQDRLGPTSHAMREARQRA